MIFSENGIKLLKELEACKLTAYKDTGGIWTIGYGSTSNVCEGMTITEEEANTRLHVKTADITNLINGLVKVPLTQNQFDALVIFTYNVGGNAFEHSTLLRQLNKKNFDLAANEFGKWNHVNGKVVTGLTNRRTKERDLFIS